MCGKGKKKESLPEKKAGNGGKPGVKGRSDEERGKTEKRAVLRGEPKRGENRRDSQARRGKIEE